MNGQYLDHSYDIARRTIDPVAGHVDRNGERTRLSRKQLEVLALLVGAAGTLVPRQAFIETVWEGNALVGERGLTDTIYALRRALGDLSETSPLIRTIPRRGYQITAEARLLEGEPQPSFEPGWPVPGRPGWRLVRRLAQSDVTETWLAEELPTGAQRVFRFCRDETHLQRLRREVTVLRFLREKLAGRSDVVTIRGWQLDEPPYFLELDPVAHGSLADWVAERGGLAQVPLPERVRCLAQAAAALEAVHAAGVCHRNLSPASILIDEVAGEPVAKLGELGLGELRDRAELAALAISAAGWTLTTDGSPGARAYLAPEQAAGGAASDVYSLGVVLYQVVLGDFQQRLEERWVAAITVPALRELIAACIDPRPERRPTARSLRRRLEALDLRGVDKVVAHPSPAPGQRGRTAVGESIGPFRLLEVLGEGGMGTVYLAEQREPVERRVALKLIRAGLDSDPVLARFEAERQALALMDHPNVATVYDAGCSASGHPYFAMEYVPGLEITAHCDRAKLGVHGRVELFLQVCDGVQHAHQKGLIHRDLKPSNLLVKSSAGQPATAKVIDFGVAKSLQSKLTDQTLHTRLGTFVGTPTYSSLEQISGHLGEVDTRSDIYSLGVVLYELLTGVTPYSPAELAGKSAHELVTLLSKTEPPPPLARFTGLTRDQEESIAQKRSESVERLKELLHTDVAWILRKCLERDPDDRYPSVLELRKDLVRWLEDRPVEARPATPAYRLRKLLKRHRTAVALAALITLALLTTTALAVFGLVRAEREAAKARAAAREAELAADFQVQQLKSLDPATVGLGLRSLLRSELRQQMSANGADSYAIEQAEQQLEGLLARLNLVDVTLGLLNGHFFKPAIQVVEDQYAEHPELQARLWQSIADTLADLGSTTTALEVQERALDRRRAVLGSSHPLTLESTRQRGNVLSRLGRYDEAKADLELAVAGLRRQLGEDDLRTLEAREDLGTLLLHQYQWDEARSHFTDVLAARRRLLGNDHEDTLSVLTSLAIVGDWTDDLETAERLFDEALAGLRRTVGAEDPATLAVMVQAASVYAKRGKPDLAIALNREAVQGMRARLGDEHPTTLSALNDLAVLLAQAKDYAGAEPAFREVLRSQKLATGPDSTDAMTTQANLGRVLSVTGRLDEGTARLQEAVDALRSALGAEHGRTRFFLFHLARLYRDMGRLTQAEAALRELVRTKTGENAAESPATLWTTSELADVLQRQGQLAEAEALHRKTLATQQRVVGAQDADTLRTQSHLAEVLRKQGQFAEAEQLLRATLELQRKDPGLESDDTLTTLGRLSEVLREQRKLPEALAVAEEATRVAARFYHPNDHHLNALRLIYGRALRDAGRSREAEPVLKDAAAKLAAAGVR